LGGLTFIYEVANSPNSMDAISRVTVTNYDNWQTDMSFQIPTANLVPALMDRSASGNVVGYTFVGAPLGPTVLVPGGVSALLVVQTNAPWFRESTGYVINGSIASGPALVPAVPEPAAMLLLVGGLVGLLARRR
jgi:hypothetical protein